jgi:hypothetical protein
MISANNSEDSGAISDGFNTMVQPVSSAGSTNEVLDMADTRRRLRGLGEVDRRAHLQADRLRHVVGAGHVGLQNPLGQRDAVVLGRRGPTRKSRLGGGDRRIRFRLPAQRDHSAGFFVRRVDDLKVTGIGGRDPPAVDVVFALLQHNVAP